MEASQALRQTVEKRKVVPKELQRALVKVDSQRTGCVNYKDFEKVFLKLCGGESNVSSDQLADIERYIDPQKDGRMDINFLTAMATVCGDVVRAEAKLKNLFKILRVRGVDYRGALSKEAGAASSYTILYFALHFIQCSALRPRCSSRNHDITDFPSVSQLCSD